MAEPIHATRTHFCPHPFAQERRVGDGIGALHYFPSQGLRRPQRDPAAPRPRATSEDDAEEETSDSTLLPVNSELKSVFPVYTRYKGINIM